MNTKIWSYIVKEAFNNTLLVTKFFRGLHITTTYIFIPVYVYGPSMLPTFNISGDFVLAEKISHRFGKVDRSDIVLIRSPEEPRKVATKRVVAVEGDNVTYSSNPEKEDTSKTIVVPKGHVWIQGDNKYMSNDSRNFGHVPYGMIEGRIFWKTSYGPKIWEALSTEVLKQPGGGIFSKEGSPFITFVLGGPGSGKGTQRSRIVETYGFTHLSAGDLLRKEITMNSKNGAMILDTIAKGKIVPSEVTIKLIRKAIESTENDKGTCTTPTLE